MENNKPEIEITEENVAMDVKHLGHMAGSCDSAPFPRNLLTLRTPPSASTLGVNVASSVLVSTSRGKHQVPVVPLTSPEEIRNG